MYLQEAAEGMIEWGPLHCKSMKGYGIEPEYSRSYKCNNCNTALDSAIWIQILQGTGRANDKMYLDFRTSLP